MVASSELHGELPPLPVFREGVELERNINLLKNDTNTRVPTVTITEANVPFESASPPRNRINNYSRPATPARDGLTTKEVAPILRLDTAPLGKVKVPVLEALIPSQDTTLRQHAVPKQKESITIGKASAYTVENTGLNHHTAFQGNASASKDTASTHPPADHIHANTGEQSRSSNDSAATLVRPSTDSLDDADPDSQTPAMRSMFPRFDPSRPVARQSYRPTSAAIPLHVLQQGMSIQRPDYSPDLLSSPPLYQNGWQGRSPAPGPPPLLRAGVQTLDANASNPEELLDLWALANGEESVEVAGTYILGLTCDDFTMGQETMCLTSNQAPVYTLQAMDGAISISRTHPLDATTIVPIATTSLYIPTAIAPLLASLNSTRADRTARAQAHTIAQSHALSLSDTADLVAEALLRAHTHHAVSLLWDSDSTLHYVTHPGLAPTDSLVAFPITRSASALTVHRSLDPPSPLLTLELPSARLTIHAPALAALVNSFVFDSLIAAFLTHTLYLLRTAAASPIASSTAADPTSPPSNSRNPFLTPHTSPMPAIITTFAPPPTHPIAAARSYPRSIHSRRATTLASIPRGRASGLASPDPSYPGSPIRTTLLSPGADATAYAYANAFGAKIDRDLEKGVAPELRRSNTGVDLSRFQSYDLDDQSLGRGTRLILRVLYWAFGVLVWCLGVGVGIVAAIVVCLGRGGKGL